MPQLKTVKFTCRYGSRSFAVNPSTNSIRLFFNRDVSPRLTCIGGRSRKTKKPARFPARSGFKKFEMDAYDERLPQHTSPFAAAKLTQN
jgi:hypothetical protein